jgi:integrase/recombinase XerD
MAKDVSMGSLRQAMEEYLEMRRRLGFKLHEAGLRLKDFVRGGPAC